MQTLPLTVPLMTRILAKFEEKWNYDEAVLRFLGEDPRTVDIYGTRFCTPAISYQYRLFSKIWALVDPQWQGFQR